MCLRFVYKTDSLMVMLLNLWGKLVAVCCGFFGNRNWHLEDLLIMLKVGNDKQWCYHKHMKIYVNDFRVLTKPNHDLLKTLKILLTSLSLAKTDFWRTVCSVIVCLAPTTCSRSISTNWVPDDVILTFCHGHRQLCIKSSTPSTLELNITNTNISDIE